MAQESQEEVSSLDHLLSSSRTFITYRPLRTEVAVSDIVTLPEGARAFEIPPRAAIDPVLFASEARAFAGTEHPILFIPGRRFDAMGTRHGQGGGWYDRFLAEVPRDWLRIGFCFDDQFSSKPLARETWDQAMDYIIVLNRETGQISMHGTDSGF